MDSIEPDDAALNVLGALVSSVPWDQVEATHKRQVADSLESILKMLRKTVTVEQNRMHASEIANAIGNFRAQVSLSRSAAERDALQRLADQVSQGAQKLQQGSSHPEGIVHLASELASVVEILRNEG